MSCWRLLLLNAFRSIMLCLMCVCVAEQEEACDHPCNDIAKGERCQKDVYEALRAGPKWQNTLLVIVYDDAGGYYDQVIPPFEDVPDDEA